MFPPLPHLILKDLPESWIFTGLVNSVVIFFSAKGIKKSLERATHWGLAASGPNNMG